MISGEIIKFIPLKYSHRSITFLKQIVILPYLDHYALLLDSF